MNLLKETLEMLRDCKKSSQDIEFILNGKTYFDWEEFEKLADFEYDGGYGGIEVDPALIIVGKDWWFERHDYDGSEWWEYKSLPSKPKIKEVPETLLSE